MPQTDQQFHAAAIGEQGAHFGALRGYAADRTLRQHINHFPPTAFVPHDVVQGVHSATRRSDPRLYDAIVADGPDAGLSIEALPRIGVEIGDIGGNRVAAESICERRLLVRGQGGPTRADDLAQNYLEIKSLAYHR